jgi:predicted homoserine dehydrogenase-like protein
VEVISSLERDGRPVFRDLRWGVYVTFRAGEDAGEDYVRRCFGEYGFSTDPAGRYAAMYKPYHAIGLELGISIASVGLRGEPTGAPIAWHGDVVATGETRSRGGRDARRRGRLHGLWKASPRRGFAPARRAAARPRAWVKLVRRIPAHAPVRWDDVAIDATSDAVSFRREMERAFAT